MLLVKRALPCLVPRLVTDVTELLSHVLLMLLIRETSTGTQPSFARRSPRASCST
jgi:hypothetical protein